MATGLVTPRAASAMSLTSRRQNLPVIEHPMSRMGDKNALKIRGTSRGSVNLPLGLGPRTQTFVSVNGEDGNVELGLDRSNLPPLRSSSPGPTGEDDTKFRHSRLLTWPPVYLQKPGDKRAKSAGNNLDIIPRNRYGPDELYELVRERLTTGYFGLRHLFKANDPQGKGVVARIALSRILYHLCGYLTPEQQQKLLERIGLDKLEFISFDDFVGRFRDNETVQREWLSPVAKKQLSAEKKKLHPEENLRDRYVLREAQRDYASATFAIALLKQKVQEGSFHARNHLPSVCFEPDGMIVPPQLRECVASIGIQLDEEEMEKLWTRYDLQGAGAISSSYFFKQIGLDGHGHPHVRIVSPGRHGKNTSRRYPKTSWVPNIPEDPDEAVDNVEETPREEVEHQLLSIPDPTFRPPSVDVVTYLTRKFEHNFHALRMGLEHFDHEGIGMVSRPDFRKVMVEYDFPMTALDCEHFLERCGVRTNDGKVNYKELLLKFMSRAEKDLAHKIISDPDHKFNNRVSTPYGFLTATDVEAKMVEYFHKDFLQLLASFRNLDKHNLGLITQKQLRDTINRINNVKCTDDQFAQLLEEIGLEDDGLVSYQKFLSLFNRKRPWTLIGVSTISTPSPRTPLQRPHTVGSVQVFTPRKEEMPPSPPPPPPQQVDKTQQTVPVTPPEYEKKWEKAAKKVGISEGSERTYHLRARPRAMLEDAIEDLLKNRFHTAQKAYHRIDRKAVGRISKPQFHKWLSELEIMLNVQELDDLWSTLQVGKDGIVHFSEIYVHFTQGREGPPPIEGKLPVESSSELVDHMKKVQQAQRQKAKELQEKAILEKERRDKVKMEKRARKMSPREHFGPPSDNLLERLRPEVVKNWNELKKQFRILDPNGYAIVKRVQVKALLQSLKFPITPEEADKLCSRFDFNVDGHFHYMQFLQLYTVPEKITSAAYCKENKLPEKYSSGTEKSDTLIAVMGKVRKRLLTEWKILRRAFKKADCNNEGVLDTLEFKQILIDNNITTSEEDIYHLLCEFDRKLDGKIVYDEFLNVIMG